MTSNFWATTLGFGNDEKIVSIAATLDEVSKAGNDPTPTSEATDLEEWMAKFYNRMEDRERDLARAHTAQLHRDDEEIEKWKMVRDTDESEQLIKLAAAARQQKDATEARLREEENQRENARIMLATEGMTDAERDAWLLDERELDLLQAKEAQQISRLAALNTILQRSVSYLAAQEDAMLKETKRQEQVLAAQRAQAELDAFESRRSLEVFEEDLRLQVDAAQPLAWRLLQENFELQTRALHDAARSELLCTLDCDIREKLLGMPEQEAQAILDDLVLLRNMQQTCRRLSNNNPNHVQ